MSKRDIAFRSIVELLEDLLKKHEKIRVQLFGVPGSGKTTFALQLAAECKKHPTWHAEYVREWYKELAYTQSYPPTFGQQIEGFGWHLHTEEHYLNSNVRLLVSDIGLLLIVWYIYRFHKHYEVFVEICREMEQKYKTVNILLWPVLVPKAELGSGRWHILDYDQRIAQTKELKQFLDENQISYYEVPGD